MAAISLRFDGKGLPAEIAWEKVTQIKMDVLYQGNRWIPKSAASVPA
jgi:hypothetical protein